MNHTELGIFGESLARNHLIAKGYQILDTNYRFRKYEADIIAMYENMIIVVEVKTRVTAEIGEPWMAVTRSKQKQIIQVADHYLKLKMLTNDTRFDVISIVHNSHRTSIEHIEGAFYPIA